MRLAIVGGKLQGIECAYLAGKAGYSTMVIDRDPNAPALSLADEPVVLDVVAQCKEATDILSGCDAVIPANENMDTLATLDEVAGKIGVPFLFDLDAYRISSSKLSSNELFQELNIPVPRPWPDCGFPVVVKPSSLSGSIGVMKAHDQVGLEEGLRRVQVLGDGAVVQEFVEGPNISVEVIGDGVDAIPLVTTEIILDDAYDCRMVLCPFPAPDASRANEFGEWGRKIAQRLSLRGIMDVEAIVKDGVPLALEIDARMPSQTPAAVYGATGINIIEMLMEAIALNDLKIPVSRQGASIYEHIAIKGNVMRSCGEGVFAQVREPKVVKGLFGSDEMITDYSPGRPNWYATIICSGATPEEAWVKRRNCLERIIASAEIKHHDRYPMEVRA